MSSFKRVLLTVEWGKAASAKNISPKDVHGALSELMMMRLNGGCVWFGPRTADPIPYPMGMPVVETIWSLCSWSLFSHTYLTSPHYLYRLEF